MDQYYKYFRWLSLDIVLGAIFFLVYLEDYYQIDLTIHVYFALASAVWLIYTVDHLIDAHTPATGLCERRNFHKSHTSNFILIGGLVLSLALVNLYFLESRILQMGALLSACCILYLLLVYFIKRIWVKELLVALAYASGIFIAPFVYGSIGMYDLILALELTLVAFTNLLIFSKFDEVNDQVEGFGSLAIRLGKVKTDMIITMLLVGIIVFSGASYLLIYDDIQLLYCAMTILLGCIYWRPAFFRKSERFRTVGDGIFYLPILFLLF